MGTVFLALFVGNIIIGWVGAFYDRMTPAAFWVLDAGIAGAGAIIVLIFGRAIGRRLTAGPE